MVHIVAVEAIFQWGPAIRSSDQGHNHRRLVRISPRCERYGSILFAVLALIVTAVSLLLGEWRLLVIPVTAGVAFADLPFPRWARRGDLPEMTVFLTTTLQAAEESKR
jgi:hypothetical protein